MTLALASTTSRATCESCGAIHDVSVPTPAFRCEPCIAAEVDAHAARTRRRALGWFGAGVALLVLGWLVWAAGLDTDLGGFANGSLGFYVVVAGFGCFGMGAGMLRFRPKLKLD